MTRKNGKQVSDDFPTPSVFEWDEQREKVAILLAHGHTQEEAGKEAGVTSRTIRNWKDFDEFSAEVDRLSLMVDIASRAERLRIAIRIVREKGYKTDRDLLDWLKFAQSETDGVKLDLTKIAAAIGETEAPMADTRPNRVGEISADESAAK